MGGSASARVVVDVDHKAASRCMEHRLPKLLDNAAVVVVEEPFCSPFIAGLQDLRKTAAVKGVDAWVLDCGSIVPSASVNPKDCTRAFAYEKATSKAHKVCITELWNEAELAGDDVPAHEQDEALKSNVDLVNLDDGKLTELVASTNVNHSVKPVRSTPG